jgi:hypothetical protein
MRTLRLFVCLLVSAPLFILGGCEKAVTPPVRNKSQVHIVTLNNCLADPNTVTVYDGDQVDWQAIDHDYTIRFKDPKEPTGNPVKVPHGGPHNPHAIHGHNRCDPLLHGEFYCDYSLTKDNETTPCPDPGIHIVP